MTAEAGAWDVTGQRVLVTGASSGLGLAMARALASGGARVALGGRDEGRLAEAVRALEVTDGDVRAVPLDVRDGVSIARAVAGVVDAWRGLDVLRTSGPRARRALLASLHGGSRKRRPNG